MRSEGETRPARGRLWWFVVALIVLAPLGAAGATQLAFRGGSPATGSAQVVTQGVSKLPGDRVAWRLVERKALPRALAKLTRRDLGFILASDEPILLTNAVPGGQEDVARLAPGESYLVKGDTRQARASLGDKAVTYLALELVPADEVDDVGSAKLLYKSDPFTAPTGERDLDLVRNVIEIGKTATVPDTGGSTVILATDGAIDILPDGGARKLLQAGESAQFQAGGLEIKAVAPATGAKRIPAAAMTDALAQSANASAAYFVAVIGEEIPPLPTPTATPTETAVPTFTPEPTETPAPEVGSIGVAVFNCPEGMTVETLSGESCAPAVDGYSLSLSAPDGTILTLFDAVQDGPNAVWGELDYGTYLLTEDQLPEGFDNYFIPGSAAVGGSSESGYSVTIDGSAPDIEVAIFNFQPAPPVQTGSITIYVFDCPPSAVPNDFSPTSCSPSAGGYDFSLSGDAFPDGYTLADAASIGGGFTWNQVPYGAYLLEETAFPDGYGRFVVQGYPYNGGGGYDVEVSDGEPNITLAVYNFVESDSFTT